MIPGVALLVARRYLLALPLATGIAALAIGIPTDVLPNPWFTRMTPVRTFDVVLGPLTSLAVGALAATFVRPSTRRRRPELGASAVGGDRRRRHGRGGRGARAGEAAARPGRAVHSRGAGPAGRAAGRDRVLAGGGGGDGPQSVGRESRPVGGAAGGAGPRPRRTGGDGPGGRRELTRPDGWGVASPDVGTSLDTSRWSEGRR
jgi:hypothetical protein